MAELKFSSEAIAKLLGKTATEVESLFIKDGNQIELAEAGSILNSNASTKINSLVQAEKDKVDIQGTRDRARKEVLQQVNDALIAKGAKGEDWKQQIESLTKAEGTKEVTESDVKDHPFFKSTVTDLKGKLEAEQLAHQTTVKTQSTKQTRSELESFARELLTDEKNGFVLPENKEIADKRIASFVRDLIEGDKKLSKDKDGNIIPVDKDGRRLQDDAFNDISPVVFAQESALVYFDKRASSDKVAPATPDDTGKTRATGNTTFPVMKSEEDHQREIDNIISNPKEGSSAKDQIAALSNHFETVVKPTLGG